VIAAADVARRTQSRSVASAGIGGAATAPLAISDKRLKKAIFLHKLGNLATLRSIWPDRKFGVKKPYLLDRDLIDVGNKMFEAFHLVGLFVIGTAILWASWAEVFHIIEAGGPKIKDVLLLFIYLELGAMVGIYFKTHRLPVRYLIYIAVTALTRVLAIDIKEMSDIHMITLTGAILLLCLSILVLRVGSTRFAEPDTEEK
jgi:phosphate starvation-inducible membrane PsiE